MQLCLISSRKKFKVSVAIMHFSCRMLEDKHCNSPAIFNAAVRSGKQ
jgi:hypothetical protein